MGTAVFLFYGYAWLCISEEYFMAMIVGLLVAAHHYMHYKHIQQIQRERALNYMVMDAVQAAWGCRRYSASRYCRWTTFHRQCPR